MAVHFIQQRCGCLSWLTAAFPPGYLSPIGCVHEAGQNGASLPASFISAEIAPASPLLGKGGRDAIGSFDEDRPQLDRDL
jgi:hypothetical protein